MKAVLPVSTSVALPKDSNSQLVSVGTFPEAEHPNEATGSSVGPNGQNPSSSVDASTAMNEMHGCSRLQPGV